MTTSSADDIDMPPASPTDIIKVSNTPSMSSASNATPLSPAGEPPVASSPAPLLFNASRQERLGMILGLHKAGKSTRIISKMIGIPSTTVRRHLKCLAKDHDNGVRVGNFDAVNNPNWRKQIENGKWFQIIKHIRDVDLPFYQTEGFKPMLRTLLYRLDSLKLLDKTKDYKSLIKYTVRAREFSVYCPREWEFYPKLPIDCFEDSQSGREVLDDYDDSEPEDPQDPDEYIENAIEELKYAPSNYDGKGTPGEEGIKPGKWYAQPNYVEAWLEEAGLGKKFRKVLDGRNIRVILNHGFSSLTFAYLNCERLKEFADEHPDKKINILYFCDLDLYGDDMDRQIQEWLDLFGIEDIVSFKRVAITQEQIEKYHLLEKPLSAEKIAFLEQNDPNRYANFVAKYGRIFATELNSMMINKRLLRVFEKIVQDSVDNLWDEDIYNENCPEEPDLECENRS